MTDQDIERASASAQAAEKHADVVSPDAVTAVDSKDPAAPSAQVTGKRQKLSDLFTIIAAGAGLASDG